MDVNPLLPARGRIPNGSSSPNFLGFAMRVVFRGNHQLHRPGCLTTEAPCRQGSKSRCNWPTNIKMFDKQSVNLMDGAECEQRRGRTVPCRDIPVFMWSVVQAALALRRSPVQSILAPVRYTPQASRPSGVAWCQHQARTLPKRHACQPR